MIDVSISFGYWVYEVYANVRIWANLSVSFKFALCVTSPSDYPTHVNYDRRVRIWANLSVSLQLALMRDPPFRLPYSYFDFGWNLKSDLWIMVNHDRRVFGWNLQSDLWIMVNHDRRVRIWANLSVSLQFALMRDPPFRLPYSRISVETSNRTLQ